MNKRFKLLLKRLLLCSLLAGSALTLNSLKAEEPEASHAVMPQNEEAEECSICIENIEPENHDSAQLTCNHTFHKECIDDWFKSQTDKNTHKSCPICRKDFNNENPFIVKASADTTPTPDVAVITEELEEQKAELALLEQEKTIEAKELAKVEEKLEDVKILPIEPIAPIKKEVVVCKRKLAKTNDGIGVCKRKIYLLEQEKIKAERQAAAMQAAAQPKKQETIQKFYGVKKRQKRKSRIRRNHVAQGKDGKLKKRHGKRKSDIRGGRVVKGKHGKLKKRHRKGARKRKQAGKQAQQIAE